MDYQSLFVRCDWNNSVFENKFGIQLLEPGTYYLSGSQNYYNQEIETVRISTNYSGIQGITINSKIISSDAVGRYYFTVN